MNGLMTVWSAVVDGLAHGVLDASWWQVLAYTLVVTHITIAAVTIFLHRSQAHRALDLGPVPQHFFRLWLWPTTGMVTKQWVAIHRKHHAKCETSEDPHSPVAHGIKTVLLPPVWTGHADFTNPFEFATFMREAEGLEFDVMLEAKTKDLSLLRLRTDLFRYAPDVAARFGAGPAGAAVLAAAAPERFTPWLRIYLAEQSDSLFAS